MTSTIPLSTDNIYKFACLFGLALIVTSIFSYVSTYTSSLDRKVKYMEVVIPLEAKAGRNEVENEILRLNTQLIHVAKSNEKAATAFLSAVLGAGIVISLFGAYQWHEKIQLRDDMLAKLQIEKLEAEVLRLRTDFIPSKNKDTGGTSTSD